ncbi:MAG: CRISPR-associated endonuclease Cas3'', partial [Deltaproteobacteria bacterium]
MFKLKSHPSPEDTLFRHLSNVGFSCKEKISDYKHYQISKYKCYDDIILSAYIIGITHDFAKATSFFQNMLLKNENRSIYSTHSALSSLFTYFVCSKIFPSNIELQCLSYVVVKRHHGNLRNILDVEADEDGFNIDVISKQIQNILTMDSKGFKAIDELKEIYKILLPSINLDDFFSIDLIQLFKDIRRNLKKIVISENIDNYFFLIALYSVLQIADKTDAGKLPTPPRLCNLDPEIIYKYREANFFSSSDKMSYLRNDAFNNIVENIGHLDIVNDRILSITLPTGFGKTIMGLTSALLIRKKAQHDLGYQPRIIYSLPFLSIIDQNAQVFKKILSYNYMDIEDIPSNMLIIHHHLSDFTYRFINKKNDWSEEEEEEALDSNNDEFEAITYRSSLFLTEGWNAEIIITTFVQLFESLITNNKNRLRKFNSISGSIIILDEIQAIPSKYWDVIENSLNYICKEFGCWILFMTATKPALLDFSKELSSKNYQYDERVKYKITKENSINSLSDFVLSLIKIKDSILVVLNTIGSSRELYGLIKNKLNLLYGGQQ